MTIRSVIFALICVGCGQNSTPNSSKKPEQDFQRGSKTQDQDLSPDGNSENSSESPVTDGSNTWIIGRPSYEPLMLSASKSGREFLTGEHWQDEESILQTESLSTLDELNPQSTPSPVPLGPSFFAQSFEEQPLSIELVQFKTGVNGAEILQKWQDQGRILYFEPNTLSIPKVTVLQDLATQYGTSAVEWQKAIRLPQALLALADGTIPHEEEGAIFARAPVIAVIDSGVDVENPILKKSIWENPIPGLQCKNDQYGCNTSGDFKKDFLGDGDVWPVGLDGFGKACRETSDNCSHGTHVAGIIAAYNSENKIGVCPFCKILPIRVSRAKTASNPGGISDSSIIRALQYLTQFSRDGQSLIRIANASFGKYQRSRSVASLIRKLANGAGGGTLLIAAASNEDSSQRAYPGSISEVISVSALENDLKKASFSNYGPSVDIAAPGVDIVSTIPGETPKPLSGTSMASPVVAGVAALVLSINPGMDAKALRDRLINTANPAIYENGGYNDQFYYPKVSTGEKIPLLGSGIVDALAALKGETREVPNASGKNRVAPGCSAVSGFSQTFSWFFLFLLFPIFVFLPIRAFKSRSH